MGLIRRPCLHRLRFSLIACLLGLTWALVPGTSGFAGVSQDDAESTANLLAALLDAGRVVVDRNEHLIDDPHRGHKGFTPEVFEKQLIEEFKARLGVDLSNLDAAPIPPLARELLPALVRASKDVVAEAQVVINQRGVGFKNFIPATFGSQAAARFSAASKVGLKQTALRPRNPKNMPDGFESEVLSRWAQPEAQTSRSPRVFSSLENGGTTLRLLTPLFYGKHCLVCHGGPAGELDILGYRKEGGREGELAGAISVSIPLVDR